MNRLLIVEEESESRRALSGLLSDSGYEVAVYANTVTAFNATSSQHFDLAIIDWKLPGMSGLELVRQLRRRSQELSILIVTVRQALVDRVSGLDSGADDYLVKPFLLPELGARVRALLRRAANHRTGPVRVGPLTLVPGEPRIRIRDQPIDLPPREFVLLETLVTGASDAVSKEAIAVRLSRGSEPPSESAIDICVYRLRRRLEPFGLKIRTLRGFGYVLEHPR